jgi:hypothetical protein
MRTSRTAAAISLLLLLAGCGISSEELFTEEGDLRTRTPSASFTLSPSAPIVGQRVTFDASASTCPRGPCTYEWVDDGPDGPTGTQWPLGGGITLSKAFSSAGTKWVRLTVTNRYGRSGTTMTPVEVLASSAPPPTSGDATAPTVSIATPTGGATVSGTVNVSGTAADNVGISKVEVQIDSGSFQVASGTSDWSYALNTTTLSNATHSLTARATDTSGNTKTATVTLTVSNTVPVPPTSPGGFPDASNTGVPVGTTLTRYTGPCTITSTTTLNNVDATGCLALLIRAPNVVINSSKLPRIDVTDSRIGSVSIADSTILGGNWSDGAVWGYNITVTRSNITGGQHNFHCAGNCTLTDSWLHDQYNPDGQSYHNNAFITNGGSNMLVRHNTLHCTAILNSTDGGCSGDFSLFGDFDPVSNVRLENNLLKANNSSISYCAYAGYQPSKPFPIPDHITFIGNVFERGPNNKCGVYGPVTSWYPSSTNVWSNNTWSDGTILNP